MDFLKRARTAAAFLLGVLGTHFACAQPVSEAAVKAAFLFKFAGYVEWYGQAAPAPNAPFTIATVDADDVAAELERLVPGRAINGRRIVVRKVRPGESLAGVQLLFIGRGDGAMAALLRQAQSLGILAVTESERGLESGSTINFVVSDERVGFEVSLEAAERSRVNISSRMLAVARRVIPRT